MICNIGPIKIPAETSMTGSGICFLSNKYVAIKPKKMINETSMKTSI